MLLMQISICKMLVAAFRDDLESFYLTRAPMGTNYTWKKKQQTIKWKSDKF